jgi:hypothetical protein
MGLLALGILWLNAGLVLAVALRQIANVHALRQRFSVAKGKGELVAGKVIDGEPLARRSIRQLGRTITTKGHDRILFTDGLQSFEVCGGAIETDDGTIEIAAAQSAESEVWTHAAREREGTACASEIEFERAFADASKFKGFARDIELAVQSGDRVWVYGARTDDTLRARTDEPLLVSLVDPVAYCESRVRILVLFVTGSLLALIAVSALALWPPHFGLVSTLGGALGLAYFLAIQPLGTAVRDAVKTPARRTVGAFWERPSLPQSAPARN